MTALRPKELPARLTGLSAPMIDALVTLERRGEVERQRNYFVYPDCDQRLAVGTITALASRGLVKISFRSGRHRARLTDEGSRYARTAISRWAEAVAA